MCEKRFLLLGGLLCFMAGGAFAADFDVTSTRGKTFAQMSLQSVSRIGGLHEGTDTDGVPLQARAVVQKFVVENNVEEGEDRAELVKRMERFAAALHKVAVKSADLRTPRDIAALRAETAQAAACLNEHANAMVAKAKKDAAAGDKESEKNVEQEREIVLHGGDSASSAEQHLSSAASVVERAVFDTAGKRASFKDYQSRWSRSGLPVSVSCEQKNVDKKAE